LKPAVELKAVEPIRAHPTANIICGFENLARDAVFL
jgi:hypothetical protein